MAVGPERRSQHLPREPATTKKKGGLTPPNHMWGFHQAGRKLGEIYKGAHLEGQNREGGFRGGKKSGNKESFSLRLLAGVALAD